jgi:hypothetical protein
MHTLVRQQRVAEQTQPAHSQKLECLFKVAGRGLVRSLSQLAAAVVAQHQCARLVAHVSRQNMAATSPILGRLLALGDKVRAAHASWGQRRGRLTWRGSSGGQPSQAAADIDDCARLLEDELDRHAASFSTALAAWCAARCALCARRSAHSRTRPYDAQRNRDPRQGARVRNAGGRGARASPRGADRGGRRRAAQLAQRAQREQGRVTLPPPHPGTMRKRPGTCTSLPLGLALLGVSCSCASWCCWDLWVLSLPTQWWRGSMVWWRRPARAGVTAPRLLLPPTVLWTLSCTPCRGCVRCLRDA